MNSVITNKMIMKTGFPTIIQKLDHSRKTFDGKTAYTIMRLAGDLTDRIRVVHETWLKLADRYAEPEPSQPNTFKLNPDKSCLLWKEGVDDTEARAAFEAFDQETFETKWRLKIETLEKADLSPSELRTIECLIDFSAYEVEEPKAQA